MCTNYTPTSRDRLKAARWGVAHLPPNAWPLEVFPSYLSPIAVRPEAVASVGASHGPSNIASNGASIGAPSGVPTHALASGDALQLEVARFGLIPPWCRDAAHAQSMAKGTYNARSETVAEKPSFRSAWKARQFALVPMESYFDPNWEAAAHSGGRSVRWRIALQSGEPFTCAALWERWQDRATGEVLTSFTLLTVNADGHALCGRLHRPGDEKRMPVIIAANDQQAWLNATPHEARGFLRTTAADLMTGGPAPLPQRAAPLQRAGGLNNRLPELPSANPADQTAPHGTGENAAIAERTEKAVKSKKTQKADSMATLSENNLSLF